MKIECNFPATVERQKIVFEFEETRTDIYAEAAFLYEWQESDYIFFPAACYNGNRFNSLKKNYPPMFDDNEAGANIPITITDVPRLETDGGGQVELTAGDVSVPCIGVFSPAAQQGFLLYTVQQIDGRNLGLAYAKGRLMLRYPSGRSRVYRWPFMLDERDRGMAVSPGQTLSFPYKLIQFSCKTIEEFYRIFFENRKCMGLPDSRLPVLPFQKQFDIQRDKFNRSNWREAGGFYGVATGEDMEQVWQPGWVGGGMSSYALMKLGGTLERERALRTLEHLFSTQAPSGFFYESTNGYGEVGASFHTGGARNWCLIRKSADVLYFLFKHFDLMNRLGEGIPQLFLEKTRKLADAFVQLWEQYGQFGQFVHLQSGEIAVGGSTSAAIAPAALARATGYWGDKRYLSVAAQSAELYCRRDAAQGYTTGGPGEILQGPDSESAFALLESLVVLYEETGEPRWLAYARHVAHLASSWVMGYNYLFPKESEFARLGMKTVGSVFANVQNKHSAPGICTLSGDSLYKLYRWTGDMLYLDLLKDIALGISQYMSTEQRPIYSWALPANPTLPENQGKTAKQETLPSGFICERVNTSDWEGEACIGGVFNGSCWPEVSNLLTLAEVMPLL